MGCADNTQQTVEMKYKKEEIKLRFFIIVLVEITEVSFSMFVVHWADKIRF